MVKFAHLADVHLGGWKQEPMQQLNFQCFKEAVNICIKERVEFVVIAGDLFDSAYPPIEILKSTFAEFKRLKEARISVFIIAGSHDYSVSGKTFLDVLEKAGFSKNIAKFDEKEDHILLLPTSFGNVAFYGYPGKKAGLEVRDVQKIRLSAAPGMYKLVALHTTLDKAKGTIPTEAVEADKLPEADYYAMGHIHIDFQYKNFVYPGPIFPNNFQELEDLEEGSFYIIETDKDIQKKISLKPIDVLPLTIPLKDKFEPNDQIMSVLRGQDFKDKVVLLRFQGELEYQKSSDINFLDVEDYVLKQGAYFVLRNTHELKTIESDFEFEVEDTENIEKESIKKFTEESPSPFDELIPQIMQVLSLEKQEGETQDSFSNRLLSESKKVLHF